MKPPFGRIFFPFFLRVLGLEPCLQRCVFFEFCAFTKLFFESTSPTIELILAHMKNENIGLD